MGDLEQVHGLIRGQPSSWLVRLVPPVAEHPAKPCPSVSWYLLFRSRCWHCSELSSELPPWVSCRTKAERIPQSFEGHKFSPLYVSESESGDRHLEC